LIEQARLKMGKLDRLLQDSQMILNGYIAATEVEDPVPTAVGGTEDVD
jgi:hypothetical protein